MRSRIWPVTHATLTLAAVGCCAWLLWRESHRPQAAPDRPDTSTDSDRPAFTADVALRGMLGAQSFEGEFTLPEGHTRVVIALLWFEDGKFRGRRETSEFLADTKEGRTVSYQILWGRGTDGASRLVCAARTPRGGSTG